MKALTFESNSRTGLQECAEGRLLPHRQNVDPGDLHVRLVDFALSIQKLSLSLRCAFGRALEHGNIAAGYSLQWHIRDQGKFGQTSSFFSTRFSFFFFSFSESKKCIIHYETTVKIPSMEGYCSLI